MGTKYIQTINNISPSISIASMRVSVDDGMLHVFIDLSPRSYKYPTGEARKCEWCWDSKADWRRQQQLHVWGETRWRSGVRTAGGGEADSGRARTPDSPPGGHRLGGGAHVPSSGGGVCVEAKCPRTLAARVSLAKFGEFCVSPNRWESWKFGSLVYWKSTCVYFPGFKRGKKCFGLM